MTKSRFIVFLMVATFLGLVVVGVIFSRDVPSPQTEIAREVNMEQLQAAANAVENTAPAPTVMAPAATPAAAPTNAPQAAAAAPATTPAPTAATGE